MDMEEMLKAAQQAAENIQKQMNDAQVKLDTIEVEGTSGGGLVKIRATAKGRILSVSIDDSLIVPEDKQMLEDLVTAAFNDARAKADQAANAATNGFYRDTRATLEGAWVRPRHDGYMAFQQEASDRVNAGLRRDEDCRQVVADLNRLFRKSFSKKD